MSEHFDAIVIGSGMGGLTFASLAAQVFGMRVLVLEQHWQAGGFTHAFSREGWRWDVGLHYLGDLERGGSTRQVFDLVTGGAVELARLPDRYDIIHAGAEVYGVPSDLAGMEAELAQRFPGDAAGLARYFKLVRRISRSFGALLYASSAPSWLGALLRLANGRISRLAQRTTAEVIADCVDDPALRDILAARWGDYGVPPHESAFGYHALVLGSYAKGACYPIGGGGMIARAVSKILRRHGGQIRLNTKVTSILVEDGCAVGVETQDARGIRHELRAPLIVSNAGLTRTAELAGYEVPALRLSPSAVTVYLGLSNSPREVGIDGANHWLNSSVSSGHGHADPRALFTEGAPTCFVSFSSVAEGAEARHTAQVIMLADPALFSRWEGTAWKARGRDYDTLKEAIADSAVERLEDAFPGIAALIAHREVSTPLTVQRFTGHERGSIYGLAVTPERLAARIGTRTQVKNLLLTGADVCSPGVQGAMMGGVFAAAAIAGAAGMSKIMRAAKALSPAVLASPLEASGS